MHDRRRHPRVWIGAGILAALAAGLLSLRTALAPADDNIPVQEIAGDPPQYETTLTVMGTDARLQVVARSASRARAMFRPAIERIGAVERRMSTYLPDSEVSRLNAHGAEQPVELSADVLFVLRKAVEASEATGGAFDVTYAPLRTLWRRAQAEGRMPGPEAVQQTLAAVGYGKLVFKDSSVGFAVPGMEVDLGGIAKGYAIDLAVAALQDAGATAGIVDIGGDLRLFGLPEPDGRWRVAVRRPPGVNKEFVLDVPACAVTTSGDYARWFEVEGRRLSHIVDPRTGQPVAHMASVTLVAPDATTADALATGVSVMGVERGLALVDSLPDVECMIMLRPEQGPVEVHMSSGFSRLLEGS